MLTQARLKELLHYCPDTGVFTWRKTNKPAGYIWSAKTNKTKYLLIGVNYKLIRAHRLAWMYVNGSFPEGQIDHVDGDGLNNRINNLRVVSPLENCRNRPKYSNNKTGVVGVFWHKGKKSYIAKIMITGKHKHLLSTRDFFEACCARKSAEVEHNFHANYGR